MQVAVSSDNATIWWSQFWSQLSSFADAPRRSRDRFASVDDGLRTRLDPGSQSWKACWVHALSGSNAASSAPSQQRKPPPRPHRPRQRFAAIVSVLVSVAICRGPQQPPHRLATSCRMGLVTCWPRAAMDGDDQPITSITVSGQTQRRRPRQPLLAPGVWADQSELSSSILATPNSAMSAASGGGAGITT